MEKPSENFRQLTINRIFHSSRHQLWQAWADPELVKKWWGPEYFTAPQISINFIEGGSYLFDMRAPDGKDFWSKGTYLQINAPTRLLLTDSFSDEKGNTVPASVYGLSPDFPLENIIVIEMREYSGNICKLTLRYSSIPVADFNNAHTGWIQSLDKLAKIIETPPENWLTEVNSALMYNDTVT